MNARTHATPPPPLHLYAVGKRRTKKSAEPWCVREKEWPATRLRHSMQPNRCPTTQPNHMELRAHPTRDRTYSPAYTLLPTFHVYAHHYTCRRPCTMKINRVRRNIVWAEFFTVLRASRDPGSINSFHFFRSFSSPFFLVVVIVRELKVSTNWEAPFSKISRSSVFFFFGFEQFHGGYINTKSNGQHLFRFEFVSVAVVRCISVAIFIHFYFLPYALSRVFS